MRTNQIVDVNWLKKENACNEGVDWFKKKTSDSIAGDLLVEMLIEDKKLEWANWLIARIMDYKQRVSYAVFAAEQVIDIFEKEYPNDKRPRKAIEAAKKCIENPSKENKDAAANAANAAYAANAAAYAANAAAYAAYAAANAANAVYAATNAANAAANAAYAATNAAYAAMKKKILEFGLKLYCKTIEIYKRTIKELQGIQNNLLNAGR